MFLFIIVIGLLLGLGAVYGLRRFRPEYVEIAAAVTLALTLLVWLIGRAALPLTATVSRWPAASQLPPLAWSVDETGWALTTYLFLLALVSLLISIVYRGEQPSPSLPYVAILLALAGAMALWPDSLAGLLAGWLLLNLTWAGILLLLPEVRGAGNRPATHLAFSCLSVLFVWLGASAAPAEAAGWDFTGWPAWAILSLLLGVLVQMSLFLLHRGRPFSPSLPAGWLMLLPTVPAIAGLGLLARLAIAGPVMADYRWLITLLVIFGALVVLLPAIGGIGLARSATLRQRWQAAAARWHDRQWSATNIGRLADGLRPLASGVGTALREAAHILEGEGGLLWLLLLVVVFWLAQRG
jgi:hypothetical protein